MKRASAALFAAFLVLVAMNMLPLRAAERISFVPWKVLEARAERADALFVLYWVPASPDEMRRSDLLTSRALAVYSSKCVAMRIVRVDDVERLAELGIEALPAAVLVAGSEAIGRAGGDGSVLRAVDVEALVRSGFDAREAEEQSALERGLALVRDGDAATAAELFERVALCRCAFPRLAKRAQRALNRIARAE